MPRPNVKGKSTVSLELITNILSWISVRVQSLSLVFIVFCFRGRPAGKKSEGGFEKMTETKKVLQYFVIHRIVGIFIAKTVSNLL